jgi:hypothetical protein
MEYLFTWPQEVTLLDNMDDHLASEMVQLHSRSSIPVYGLLESTIDLQADFVYTQKPQTVSTSHFLALKLHLRTC